MAKLKQVVLNQFGFVDKATSAKFLIQAYSDDNAYFGIRVSGPHTEVNQSTSQNPRRKGKFITTAYMDILVGGPARYSRIMEEFINQTLEAPFEREPNGSRMRYHVIMDASAWALVWSTKFDKLMSDEISRFDNVVYIERVKSFRRLMG